MPKNIEIINGNSLITLLKEHNLEDYIEKIRRIQKEKVNSFDRIKKKGERKQEIIDYIKNSKLLPTIKEVENTLRLDLRTYFPNIRDQNKLIKK